MSTILAKHLGRAQRKCFVLALITLDGNNTFEVYQRDAICIRVTRCNSSARKNCRTRERGKDFRLKTKDTYIFRTAGKMLLLLFWVSFRNILQVYRMLLLLGNCKQNAKKK